MGYLTGTYLASQIIAFDVIIDYFIQVLCLDLETLFNLASQYEIPVDYQTEMQGIADATGLTYLEILLQVVFLDFYYGILIPLEVSSSNIGACTAFAVKNSNLLFVHGQNMDFSQIFSPTLVWVQHKILGQKKFSTFSLRMGASTLAIGKNRRVSSTLNLVQTWKMGEFGIPTSIKCRMAFEGSKTASKFLAIMTSSYCASWNYIICDKTGTSLATETVPGISIVKNINKRNFAVKSNTFTSKELKVFLLDPVYSIARQEKAEELISSKLSQKRFFKVKDGIETLRYNDGTDASICRYADPYDPMSVGTLASFTTSFWKKGYFGIGTPDINLEKVPI